MCIRVYLCEYVHLLVRIRVRMCGLCAYVHLLVRIRVRVKLCSHSSTASFKIALITLRDWRARGETARDLEEWLSNGSGNSVLPTLSTLTLYSGTQMFD